MNIVIRKMVEADRSDVIKMMRVFYASDAVATNGSEEIFRNDIDACVGENPYLEGYIFDDGNNACGYAMLAKSYSTEYGKPCIWIEDIYLKEDYRGKGFAGYFFKYIEEKYSDCLFRLEVEEENEKAIKAYKKSGFDFMPYMEMKK